jgi:hypothetical protein
MQAQVPLLDGSKAVGITFTDKPVTAPWRVAGTKKSRVALTSFKRPGP